MERTGSVAAAVLVRSVGLILSGTLSACLPVRITGYEPSGVGDQVSMMRAGFGCFLGVGNVLRTEAKSGVVIYTAAGLGWTSKGQISLAIRFVVPADVTVRLLSPDFIAESPEWEGTKTLFGYLSEMRRTADNYGIFDLRFTTWPEVQTFRLKFPLLAINNDTYQPPDVLFRPLKEWGIGAPCT